MIDAGAAHVNALEPIPMRYPDDPRPTSITSRLLARLPEGVRLQLRDSFDRLKKIRSLDDAGQFVTEEVQYLLGVVAPSFARYPLPVGPRSGRLLVAAAAGGAALVEEFEAVATLFTAGAASPGAPAVLATDFAALVVEAYVAASVRVRDLEKAGLPVFPEEVARDLAQAMTGSGGGGQRDITKAVAGRIARRVLRRWAAGAAPIAGIVYDGWDAQKTVAAIARLPLPPPDGG